MQINLKELVFDCELNPELIRDNDKLREITLKAIKFSGAKIYGKPKSDIWKPHGLQFYVTITTSHLVLTTYPEKNYLTINYATCGNVSFEKFLSVIVSELKPTKIYRNYATIRTPDIKQKCDFKPEYCIKYPKCKNCIGCKTKI